MIQQVHGSPKYKRVLLKLSGEALANKRAFGIESVVLQKIALEIGQLVGIGVQVGMVVGGGNLFRGSELYAIGMDRVAGDHMGMLATVMNGLAIRDALEQKNISTRLLSAIPMSGIVEHYDRRNAIRYLSSGEVVIFSAGTGNPFFTTDSAACLRAIEVNADVMFKATKVDGVYDCDPHKNPTAKMFKQLSYDDLIKRKLRVMDLTAVCLARDNGLPVHVFNFSDRGKLLAAVCGEQVGTSIHSNNKNV